MSGSKTIVFLLLGVLLLSGIACGQTTWDLQTIVDGQGGVSPSTGTFADGDAITLTATPASGWEFSHWGGHGSGAENPFTLSMDSDKTVYAYFTEMGEEPTPTPTASPTEANPTQTVTGVSAPNPISPHNGATDVGTLVDNMANIQLKWSDVDWENKQIYVQRTYTKASFFPTKTKASVRKIDLGPKVIKELKKWKLQCPKNELGLIFPNKSGKPMNYSNMVNRHFLPTLENAKLPKIRFHDLRHTFASLLIDQGENIKYIQHQLGHSSPTVTLNVYAHLMKSTNQAAACKLEDTVFEQNGSKMVANISEGHK